MLTRYTNVLTLMGWVQSVDVASASLVVRARSGDVFNAVVGPTTVMSVITNLDEIDNDPYRNGPPPASHGENLARYVRAGQLILLDGILMEDAGTSRFECRIVHVLHNTQGELHFEHRRWWIHQIQHLCNRLIGDMWGDENDFDFSRYRTNLGVAGEPARDDLQEVETLGRLLYGFATAYLLTGNDRYLDAARAGVAFQRQWFRNVSHDGQRVMWSSWKSGTTTGMGSRSGDDAGTLPIYEQIYALAGLTQYYRVTLDPEVLLDIRRTVASFDHYFLDESDSDGYFSHLDPATMSPLSPALGQNRAKKNWNSVGDHLPAYLINLLIALKPLPRGRDTRDLDEFVGRCERLLRRCATLIVDKFPDPDPAVAFVRERFHEDWTPDTGYGWQQNRAVCGHNVKIAWNLSRAAQHYQRHDEPFARRLLATADSLGTFMGQFGVDQVRGGLFDCMERNPTNGMFIEFAWWNTKDFWQQEQAILAYLILFGSTQTPAYLELARETMAYWNTFFLDHDAGGVYFRTTADGAPVLIGADYRNQTGHAKSGYHCYELAYLAHIYLSTFVCKRAFSLNFKPDPGCGQTSINVLPDFLPTDAVRVTRIIVNGIERDGVEVDDFQIELSPDEVGAHVLVGFEPVAPDGSHPAP